MGVRIMEGQVGWEHLNQARTEALKGKLSNH